MLLTSVTSYQFAESTRLPYPYPLDPSSISRLLQRITTDKIERFMTVLNDLYFKEHYQEDDRVFLAFDFYCHLFHAAC